VVASTVIVFVGEILLLLERPNARGGLLLIQKASFARLARGHRAPRTWVTFGGVARVASVRIESERVPGTRRRTVLLVATLAMGLVVAVLAISDVAAGTSHGLATNLGEH
jgi:hypothetical protein